MKATGTKTESSTSVIAMIGAVISRIASLVASAGVQLRMLLHHALDVLDHDDGVVDDDADGQHDGEQRHGVGGIADRVSSTAKVPIRLTGTAMRRDERGAEAAEEQEHHDHDQDEGLARAVMTSVDGVL